MDAGGVTGSFQFTLAVAVGSGDTIDGDASISVTNNYGGVKLVSDGISKWIVRIPNVSQGGTGARDGSGARSNLGAAKSGLNTDITEIRGDILEPNTGTTAGTRRFALTRTTGVANSSNYLTITTAASGGSPILSSNSGVDTNVDLTLNTKGAGKIWLGGEIGITTNVIAAQTKAIKFYESRTNYASWIGASIDFVNPTSGFGGGIALTYHPQNNSPNGITVNGLVLTSQGLIGIGTDSPNEKLHVVGNVLATNFVGNGSLLTGISLTVSNPNRLIGRASTGSGSHEEITIGSGLALSGNVLSATGGTGGGFSVINEVWISSVDNGVVGTGSFTNPYDGSTQAKFDAVIASIPTYTLIHLSSGVFTTTGVSLKEGWIIQGAGKSLTTIKLVANSVNNAGSGYILYRFDFQGFLNYCEVRDLTLDMQRDTQAVYLNDTARTRIISATTTAGSTTITSSNANFTSADVNLRISGTGISTNLTTIVSVTNSTTAVLSLAATGAGTNSININGYGYLEALVLAAKSAKLYNIRTVGVYANPGEGFPLRVYHDGSVDSGDRIEIFGCESISPRGYLTAISVFDQGGGTVSGFIKNCFVKDGPSVVGFGAGGWRDFEISDNRTDNVGVGIVIDTHDYYNLAIERNHFVNCAIWGMLINGGGVYQNLKIRGNYISTSSTSQNCVIFDNANISSLDFSHNSLVHGNVGTASIRGGANAKGLLANNVITETVVSSGLGTGILLVDNINSLGARVDFGRFNPSTNTFGGSGANHSTGLVPDPGATVGAAKFLREDATWQALPSSGTVSSVGLSMPSIFTVTNSPVTNSGTLTAAYIAQASNLVFAGPVSGTATPSFRSLVAADLPSIAVINSFQNIGNAAATITNGVREVFLNTALTASRTFTLPLANSYPAGGEISITNLITSGIPTSSNLNIARAGTDTINGSTATLSAITGSSATDWNSVTLISDGVNKWVLKRLAIDAGGTGGNTAASARANLSAAKSGANTDITSLQSDIRDDSGKNLITRNNGGVSAVNNFMFTNSNTGSSPSISAVGPTDANIDFNIIPKGLGKTRIGTVGAGGVVGYIDLSSGATAPGGNLILSNGGGSIDTTGVGSIQLGVTATRTTLIGSATVARTITLPNVTGTLTISGGTGNLDLSNYNVLLPSSMTLQFRRGTYAELQTITLASGEPSWTEDTKEFYIGDGSTVGGQKIGFVVVTAPLTSNSTGIMGQQAYDSNYHYICISTNTWKRTPLSSW